MTNEEDPLSRFFSVVGNSINGHNPHHNTESSKIEKLFRLPKELFEAVDFSGFGIIDELEPCVPKFIEGENYSLKGASCDGFDMDSKVYQLIKVVDNFNGTPINSLIVKQIEGKEDTKFTLSKNDCACHNIAYEKGLQLFPKSLPWNRVKNRVPFDQHNLSTTPLSDIDNTIRYAALKLNGFKDYIDSYVITPSGHIIKEEQFVNSIRVSCVEPIVYGNGYIFTPSTHNLKAEIIYPKDVLYNHGNFISSNDEIYLLIDFKQEQFSLPKGKNTASIDEFFGIEPKYIDGFDPNEFFTISWDELGALTIEEYEMEKAEKAKREEERIKKIEEDRKRKIEEEEKRIRQERKNKQDTLNRMKNYQLTFPTIPTFPTFQKADSVESIDNAVEELNTFLTAFENSLNIIKEDLTTIQKLGWQKQNSLTHNDYRSLTVNDYRRMFNPLSLAYTQRQ